MRGLAIIAVALFAPLAFLAILLGLSRPYEAAFLDPGVLSFSAEVGEKAFEYGRTMAKRFPLKHSGSNDLKDAFGWLQDKLKAMGYDVRTQEFTAYLGTPVVLYNVVAVKKGTQLPEEHIVLLANYDQAPTSVEAASDTSAHVGTVLGLAELFSRTEVRRTLVIALVDGEEWGMVGAREFAKEYPERAKVKAAIVMEDLAVGRLLGIRADPIGQFGGYSPLWLRSLLRSCAVRLGLAFEEPYGFSEYAERAVLISFTDQGPLLAYGIPAIEVSTWGDSPELANKVYHMPSDVWENIRPESVALYGSVGECVLRTLDKMEEIPMEPMLYLKLWPESFVPAVPLLAAQLLLFSPLFVQSALTIRVPVKARLGEIANYAKTLTALLLGYAATKALPLLGIMPYYELYPPPPRHPMLYEPNWLAMAIFAAVALGSLYLLAVRSAKGHVPSEVVKAVELELLAVLALLALAHNPFGATLFLTPAAYNWLLVKRGRRLIAKICYTIALIAGGTVLYILVAAYAIRIELGLEMLWYLFMGSAYNLFTPYSILLFLAVMAVGLRLLIGVVWAECGRGRG